MLNGEASSVFGPLKLKVWFRSFFRKRSPTRNVCMVLLGERNTMPFSKVSLNLITSVTQEATTSYPSRSAKD